MLNAGEGFTYSIAFDRGARVAGAAPSARATVKVPVGARRATVTLRAETNLARTAKVAVSLAGGSSKGGVVRAPKLKALKKNRR